MTKQTNRKKQYKAGERIHQTGDNMRFDQRFAEEVAKEIARKLFGMWDWRGALKVVDGPSGLQALINRWLRLEVPALAYSYVSEIDASGHMSSYVRLSSYRARK